MKLFLIITVLLACTVHAEPTIEYVSCGYAGSPDSLTGIGDSRAYQMDAYKDKKNEAGVIGDAISIALSPADDKGKLIISPNQVNMISRAANGITS